MAQEAMPQSFSFSSTFNDSRKIGNAKTFAIPVLNHSKLWYKCSKSVRSDLWLCSSDHRKQGRFTCIGKPYQANISQYFQLKHLPAFHTFLAWLCMIRSLVGRRSKI